MSRTILSILFCRTLQMSRAGSGRGRCVSSCRDGCRRWLWRLVRLRWLGVHGSGLPSLCRGNETESIRIFGVFGALLGYWRNQYSEELACGGSLNLCRSWSIKGTMSKRVTIAERYR
jgi:hypothetical protein